MDNLVAEIQQGNRRALARFISLVENERGDYSSQLEQLSIGHAPVIGVTGPPGAGKSTLINALAGYWLSLGKRVAIIAVDPSSPFSQGAIMGDRLRMSEHFLNEQLFIRSMASRGSLGGLAPKVFEVCDILRASAFDYVIIETVGVGQSEVEIASLADTTVLVLVPEAGDEIQTIKSGIMEIADVFVLNKSDRDGSEVFARNLLTLAHQYATPNWEVPVVKTVASHKSGVELLANAIEDHRKHPADPKRKIHLLAQKALLLIRALRTRDIVMDQLEKDLANSLEQPGFNLYRFISGYSKSI